jgi:hypothetical protein
MCERKKKITFEQLRTLYALDIPSFAEHTGLETGIIYHALLQKPIQKNNAEKILAALSHHTGLQLTFDQIDLVTWEDYLFLWIIRASPEEQQSEACKLFDEYHFVYARDQKQAADLASQWREQHPHLLNHSYTPCPEGIIIGDISIPGHLQAEALPKNFERL